MDRTSASSSSCSSPTAPPTCICRYSPSSRRCSARSLSASSCSRRRAPPSCTASSRNGYLMPQLSIARLFEDNRDKLKLTWTAGVAGATKDLNSELIKGSSKGLIGHLNFIHPNWIQVLGTTEIEYLESVKADVSRQTLVEVAQRDLACFIVAGS